MTWNDLDLLHIFPQIFMCEKKRSKSNLIRFNPILKRCNARLQIYMWGSLINSLNCMQTKCELTAAVWKERWQNIFTKRSNVYWSFQWVDVLTHVPSSINVNTISLSYWRGGFLLFTSKPHSAINNEMKK